MPSTAAQLAPSRTTLANGVVVTTKATAKTPAATVNLAIRVGSARDPRQHVGATHLLAQVIDRGTASRSAVDLAVELENRGISLGISATRHQMTFAATCLSEDVDFLIARLAEIVRTPTVPDDELTTRKGEVITAIRQDEDNPAVRAVEGLMALLYGAEHPYGRPAKGTIASVEALTREQLLTLHRDGFAPQVTSLVVAGDVDASRIVDVAEGAFGDWRVPAPARASLPETLPATARRRAEFPMMNKAQADIAYGFVTIARSDPDFYPFTLMNNVLGQYALGGRLGDSIRERQGMAYYVSSVFDGNVIRAPLMIRAGVSAANVDRALASIDEEIAAIAREGVTAKELTESRQYLVGSLPRALETNAGIAQFLQTAEFFGLGTDYDRRLPDLLAAVTRDQVHDVARRYLDPDRAAVVVAGPYRGEGSEGPGGAAR